MFWMLGFSQDAFGKSVKLLKDPIGRLGMFEQVPRRFSSLH